MNWKKYRQFETKRKQQHINKQQRQHHRTRQILII